MWVKLIGELIGFAFLALSIRAIQRGSKGRSADLAQLAARMGFRFSPENNEFYNQYDVFIPVNKGTPDLSRNLMRGSAEGLDWEIFDFVYFKQSVLSGRGSSQLHECSIVCALVPYTLPCLQIRPEGIGDKLAALVGWNDTKTGSEPFDARFHVHSVDADFAVRFLDPQMIRFLMSAKPRFWQIRERRIVLFKEPPHSVDEIRAEMALIKDFVAHIPTAVTRARATGISDQAP